MVPGGLTTAPLIIRRFAAGRIFAICGCACALIVSKVAVAAAAPAGLVVAFVVLITVLHRYMCLWA